MVVLLQVFVPLHPRSLSHHFGLFYLRLLLPFILSIWVIWVCINKLWGLSGAVSLPSFVVPCCLSKDPISVWCYHCMHIPLKDLLWPPSTFLTKYCNTFFDLLPSFFKLFPQKKVTSAPRSLWGYFMPVLEAAFLTTFTPLFVSAFSPVFLHLLRRLIISTSSNDFLGISAELLHIAAFPLR